METLATIAVPVYRRLHFLPGLLKLLETQDYPAIDLLVSDNGENGAKVRQIVEANYSRPFTFRQNPKSVPITEHFNQLVQVAQGEYFLVLADDDEITPNFVSEIAAQFQRHPNASIGFGRQEFMTEQGQVTSRSRDTLPDALSGKDFIIAAWHRYEFGFQSVSCFLAKTELMRACGIYPDIPTGTYIDDALVVKMALGHEVVFSSKCAFRNRVYESSHGFALPIRELASATKAFIQFLNSDAAMREFATRQPQEYSIIRDCMQEMAWQTYLHRWKTLYRKRLSYGQWVRAAFFLPLIPAYYKRVGRTLLTDLGTNGRPPQVPAA